MKNRKVLGICLGVVSVFILGIVVAYAALSTTLNARFNGVTAGDIRWDVGFNTRNTSIYGTSSGGATCGIAHVTSTGVTFDQINLTTSGASCQYIIPVTNNGNLTAKLSSITALKPNNTTCTLEGYDSTMICGNIKYNINPGSATNHYLGLTYSQVEAGATENMMIEVTYNGTSSMTPVTQEGAGFIFNFAQA